MNDSAKRLVLATGTLNFLVFRRLKLGVIIGGTSLLSLLSGFSEIAQKREIDGKLSLVVLDGLYTRLDKCFSIGKPRIDGEKCALLDPFKLSL